MNWPIRVRLTVLFAALCGLLFVLFGGFVYSLMSGSLERDIRQEALHDLGNILRIFQEETFDKALVEMDEESEEFKAHIRVADPAGKTVYASPGFPASAGAEGPPPKADGRTVFEPADFSGVPHLLVTQPMTGPEGKTYFLQVAKGLESVRRVRRNLALYISVGTVLVVALSVVAGLFFARRALVPIDDIRRRAEDIRSSGDLSTRLAVPPRRDELSRLTETLNRLLESLEESFEEMRRFTADASHELRIPLTGLIGTLEVALRRDRPAEEYRASLKDALEESERLARLVENLLFLVKSDARQMEVRREPVDLREFLEDLLRRAQTLDPGERVRPDLGEVPEGEAAFDPEQVRRLLLNLLDNAVKYGGRNVRLSARKTGGQWEFSVSDDGPGIPAAERENIFNRFHRLDKSRSRESGGAGLGLAIARSIAEAHGGTLTVGDASGGGSVFYFRFPH